VVGDGGLGTVVGGVAGSVAATSLAAGNNCPEGCQ